ncbi:hypothetical protein QR680_008503 [Steinernema hermaphroditum]|uniref:Serpentine receptor class gamma n=1 Tax=Steinernema hermaphroditum TaxID=289476 RepID=A0AA39M7Z6_9BILA|nr:hypothetical protein QR680_008503 [Steinernema hermaphroditum]
MYGIPSLALYVVILVQIIRNKHDKRFNRPFYRLCFLIGLVALYFISASTKNEVMMTTINSTLPWLMDLKFLSPPWIVLFVSSSVRETVMKMLPARLSPNHIDAMNSETIALIVSLLYGIPSFVLYALILFQMIRPKYRKTFSNAFFRLCFAIGVVVLVYVAMYYTNSGNLVAVLYTLVPWISDLKYLSPPWVLVIVSTSVRETVIKALPRRLLQTLVEAETFFTDLGYCNSNSHAKIQ